ncbi:hypothetical protein GCM10010121_095620 [Streptomyces brasiliensis]|uniref:Tyr recombinase domain-containing protein n=1 Tax=Streptomyces brasiliensis TaxID=1954 RepID=A0A917PBQ3_9ACTN|nr:hypothetical protein GCM10010121_095620 [Streptomyces brasiliensis]
MRPELLERAWLSDLSGRGRRLVAFYAVLYYAGLRPAEAVGLRLSDCHLPETSWGTLTLRETRPVSVSSGPLR